MQTHGPRITAPGSLPSSQLPTPASHLRGQDAQARVSHVFKMSMSHLGNIKLWFNDSSQVLLNYKVNILDIFFTPWGLRDSRDWEGILRNEGVSANA